MTGWRHFIEKMPGVIGLKDGHAFALGHTVTLPTCEARRQGEERLVRGTAGVATRRVICSKDAADVYAWSDMTAATATQSVTIASGAVTLAGAGVRLLMVDTQAAAATDDLDTISGGTSGQMIVVQATDNARTVVAKDNTGNLRLAGDFSLNHTRDTLTLVFVDPSWLEVAHSDNEA